MILWTEVQRRQECDCCHTRVSEERVRIPEELFRGLMPYAWGSPTRLFRVQVERPPYSYPLCPGNTFEVNTDWASSLVWGTIHLIHCTYHRLVKL